ncbi:MAG: corrinoid protein [Gracilibacteraceae bacterium]|jgi:trimethylamine corrinoid protein|nr:corrinoid protein [Gracilibacteraceae bacterium]
MDREEILAKLKDSITEMDVDLAEEAARAAAAAGIDANTAITEGLSLGMAEMSDLFDEGEVFVPHLLVAAEAFEKAVAILTAGMSAEEKAASSNGKVLIHTVQGDIHDIGKNIVKTMFLAGNFEVFDLGRDVPVEEVVAKAKEYGVDVICGSALMTTTMPAQKDILRLLEEEGVRDRFIVLYGGAPVSREWCERIGADGYGDTAPESVALAKRLLAARGRL